MSLALLLLVAGFILFVLAAVGVGGRINLVAAGLAAWILAVLLGGAPHLLALAIAGAGLQASLVPMPLVAAAAPMDPQVFNLVVAALVGAASSYILKWAPASWKGKPMVVAAFAFSIGLELAELYVTGGLAHWSWSTAADLLAAIVGQRGFFDLLKDDLQLQDPPGSGPAGPSPAAGSLSVSGQASPNATASTAPPATK